LSYRTLVVAVVAAGALAGCATILGLEHNDGVDSGVDAAKPDAAKPDAAQPPRDARARDARMVVPDAGNGDASVQPDAGEGDASSCPQAFCACLGRDAALCLDFDEGTSASDFGVVVTAGGGQLSLAATAISPPSALESLLPASGTAGQASLAATVGVSPNYDLNFDVRIGPCALVGGTTAVGTLTPSTGSAAVVNIFGVDGGVAISLGTPQAHGVDVIVPLGTWTAVQLQVVVGEEEILTVGGISDSYPLAPVADAAVTDAATLLIGQLGVQSNACTVLIDNVTVDQGI
jgi:hypothetical protein